MEIYSIFSLQLIFYSVLFIVAGYFSFYIPGVVVLNKSKVTPALQALLSLVIGMVLWGIQAYIFGYASMRFLTYGYLGVMLFFAYRRKLLYFPYYKEMWLWITSHKKLTVLILVGLVIQLIPIVNSGLKYTDGVRFFGVNAYDGVMHLAYIQSIVHNFPPVEPGAVGHAMTNYHYWSDMMMAELVRVWRLPADHLYFQFLPVFISLLTVLASFQIMKKLGFSRNAGFWCFFFLFFAGDATYLLVWLLHGQLNFVTPAIDNGANQFLNMPNAIARPIFLSSIITLSYWIQEKKRLWGLITVLIFSALVGIKVYYGMFVILGLALVVSFILLKNITLAKEHKSLVKKIGVTIATKKYYLIFFALLSILAAAIYLPPNKGSGGLAWLPLEWPKIFLGTGGVNWEDWWLRRQVYEAAGSAKNLFILNSIAIVIALICVHGTRLVGLHSGKRVYKKLGWEMTMFLIPGLLVFHVLGLFTIQKSGGYNVFNFFVVGTVVLSIMSAALLDVVSISKKYILISLIACGLVVLTVPRVIFQVSNSFDSIKDPSHDSTLISNDELDALKFIYTNTPSNTIVQSHPKDPYDSNTPYVSFFTDRLTYLTGGGLQLTHNQPVKARQQGLLELFNAKESPTFFSLAEQKGITIIYLKKNKEQQLLFNTDPNLIKKIYENKSVVVYKINSKKIVTPESLN